MVKQVNGANQSGNNGYAKLSEDGSKYLGTARQILKSVSHDIQKMTLKQGISKATKSNASKVNGKA